MAWSLLLAGAVAVARARRADRRLARTSADLWWAVVAGVGNGFGTAFLYRGLSSGRMGVVAPVSGVGAALVPVVVGVLTGERPSALVWVGHRRRPARHLAGLPRAGGRGRRRRPAVGRPASSTGCSPGSASASLFAALAQIPE